MNPPHTITTRLEITTMGPSGYSNVTSEATPHINTPPLNFDDSSSSWAEPRRSISNYVKSQESIFFSSSVCLIILFTV